MMIKLSDYVATFLVDQGVRHIFLLPGGGAMHLCDSVGRHPSLEYIACLHEQSCAFAAEAYAEYSQTLGCVLVTSGPGGTNTITGVAAAWIEGSAVLFISGQAKRSDLMTGKGVRSMGPQEVDIASIVRPITKYAVQVTDPGKIRYELEKAVNIAISGRKGPVWIDLPLDIQAAQIEPDELEGYINKTDQSVVSEFNCLELLSRLAVSQRPVIYAGGGVRSSGAVREFLGLVEELGIPVLLSWKGADLLPDSHPCYVGRPGAIGQRAANIVQQKADWMLILGARLDLPSVAFNYQNFAPRAYKAIIDIDGTELNKFPAGIMSERIQMDLRHAIPALRTAWRGGKVNRYLSWTEYCRGLMKRFPPVLPEHRSTEAAISTYALIEELSAAAREGEIIVPGSSGPCSDILMQAWTVKKGQRILNAPGLGAMGTGLPATIGVSIAAGGNMVINVNGDGGFQLNIQELETVRRLNLPIKYFILDNGGYRSIVAMQRAHFKGRLVASDASSGLSLPNVRRIAGAYGIQSCEINDSCSLRDQVRNVLGAPGPVVCVVHTPMDEVTMPRCMSEVRPDGTIVSRAMEDMWPCLNPDDLRSIMDE